MVNGTTSPEPPPDHLSAETDSPKPNACNVQLVLLMCLTLLVSVAVIATHAPALEARAIWIDDTQYLTQNKLVRSPGWASAKQFFTEVLDPSTVRGPYHPLSMVFLMVEYAMVGGCDNLRPYHYTSIVMHAVNTALVILLLYLLFGQPWTAGMVGLLYGVHPVTVEVIPWLSEQKTLLICMLSLLCLITYVRFVQSENVTWFVICAVTYLLALLGKPNTAPLPLLMLLLDFWPLRRCGMKAVIEKIPLFAIGGVFALIAVASYVRTAKLGLPGEQAPLQGPLILCHNIVLYLREILLPLDYASPYPFPKPMSASHPMVLAGLIGTAVLTVAIAVSVRWTRAFAVGGLFFLLALFPTSSFVRFSTMAAGDKYAYFPLVGLLLPLTWALTRFWSGQSFGPASKGKRIGLAGIVLLLAAAEVTASRQRHAHWKNTETIARQMVRHHPECSIYQWALGNALIDQHKTDEALIHYLKALEINPGYANAHHNVAAIFAEKGELERAEKHYREALRLTPNFPVAHYNFGNLLLRRGEVQEAITHFEQAVRLNPRFAAAHQSLITALLHGGQTDRAIEACRQALAHCPRQANLHHQLGTILYQQGRTSEASAEFRETLRINPDHQDAKKMLRATTPP
ncbi:MAG: tetratricopeptide repeat protein [Phycisphaerae bacterium]|nr:tetratricopeptide repeat protein [Phycisphaerae bacterium]